MKKEDNNSIDPIKKWMVEAGPELLGADFHASVLKKFELLPKVTLQYEPVISPLGWKLILVFISLLVGSTLVFIPANQEEASIFDKLPTLNLTIPNFVLSNFKLPLPDYGLPFLLGIATFFILGFIMILGTIRNKQAHI
jgi:hypothetical protein